MTFFWTNVTQVLLLGDTSRCGHVPSVASGQSGQAGHGAVGFSGMQPPFLPGIQGSLQEFCSH